MMLKPQFISHMQNLSKHFHGLNMQFMKDEQVKDLMRFFKVKEIQSWETEGRTKWDYFQALAGKELTEILKEWARVEYHDLLIEIRCEEIPWEMQPILAESLLKNVCKGLRENRYLMENE